MYLLTKNVDEDYSIVDAPLTALGKKQAQRLPQLTQDLQSIAQVVLSSPLRRTLQTTALGYPDAVKRLGGHAKVVCLPQLQECSANPCDTGSSRAELEAIPEFARFDLSHLTDDWTSKAGFYGTEPAALDARARWIRQYLRERPEEHIVVVAHGDILRRVIGEEYPWTNAEVRLFQFDPATVADADCPLFHVQDIAAGGRTDADLVQRGAPANSTNALPAVATVSEDVSDGSGERIASMEARVKQIQASVQSQASELEDLDRRLAAAEAKKAALEKST